MVFDESIPKYNSKRQLQQSNLAQISFEPIPQSELAQQAEPDFLALVAKTPVAIFVIQAEKIAYANQAAALIASPLQLQFLANSDLCRQLNAQNHRLDSSPPSSLGVFEIKVKEEQKHWFECWWSTIEWSSQPAIMVTAIDVAEYKQAETKIQQALSAEKTLSQNKTKLVSMVSHELRTPLNIISFSTSLLKRHLNQWNEAKQLKYLDRIQTAAEQLGSLMDEVLIIGKAEAGKLKFAPQPLDLNLFCQSLLTEINLSHTKKSKINFVNNFAKQTAEQTILADKNLLKLALINILGNAIKYSPAECSVEFTVARDDEHTIFRVADRGIGIPEEEQSKIFEPFHRSNNVGSLPGNGLGLAIAKKVVELQGGQISVESLVDRGSIFVVKIPGNCRNC